LKPARANSSGALISKIPITKRAGGVAQGEDPEFKPQYHKTKQTTTMKQRQWGAEVRDELCNTSVLPPHCSQRSYPYIL
jgi:hypothetical protein